MRPNHLKYPFLDGNIKRIYIEDRVWYIPEKGIEDYTSFKFPGWDSPELFGNSHPVEVEYCSGNGAWIAHKAQANPQINYVAIEKRFDRVKKIWAKIKNFNLNNLIIVFGEGLMTTRYYFPDNSFSAVYVNFPDPWPKRHHAKFRIISLPFVNEMQRCLHHDAKLIMVTDDPPYSKWMIKQLAGNPSFVSEYPEPFFATEFENYGTSYFEELWRSRGLQIHYHSFINRKGV